MRRIPALVLLAGNAFAWQAPRVAPDLAIHMDGKPDLRLSAYKGKVVLLALLNTGCSHCQAFARELGAIEKDYRAKGVQVLAAVFDTGAKAGLTEFRSKYVQGYPVGYSDEATVLKWLGPDAEQGYFVPIVAFIDRKGRLVSQHLGDNALFQDPERNIRAKLDKLIR